MLVIKDSERDYTKLTKTSLVFIVAIFLFVIFGFYLVFSLILKNPDQTSVNPKEDKKTYSIDNETIDNQLNYLNSRNKVVFSSIEKETTFSSQKLPVQIIKLLPSTSVEIYSKSIDYIDGKKGYEIVHKLNGDLQENFKLFTGSFDRNVWSIVSAAYTQKAGLVTIDNEAYLVSVEFTQKENTFTSIKMKIIVKK